MRENYPKEGAPDIARLQDWVFRDTYMDLGDAVDKVRKAAIKKAEEMAKDDKIVYASAHPTSSPLSDRAIVSAIFPPSPFGQIRSATLSTLMFISMLYASKTAQTLRRGRKHSRI